VQTSTVIWSITKGESGNNCPLVIGEVQADF